MPMVVCCVLHSLSSVPMWIMSSIAMSSCNVWSEAVWHRELPYTPLAAKLLVLDANLVRGMCRAIVLNSHIEAALAANAAAIVTWQVLPVLIDLNQTYDFTWDSDAGQVIQALTAYATCLVG